MSQFGNFTTTQPVSTTEKPSETDDTKYLIVPLVVIVLVMLFAILVYFMVKRRRMNKLRHTILKLYDFDSNEQEWESLTASNEYSYYNNEFVTTTF